MKKLILLLFALSFLFSCANEKIDCEEKENEESCKFMEDWNKSGKNLSTFGDERWHKNVYKGVFDCFEKENETEEEKKERESRCVGLD